MGKDCAVQQGYGARAMQCSRGIEQGSATLGWNAGRVCDILLLYSAAYYAVPVYGVAMSAAATYGTAF